MSGYDHCDYSDGPTTRDSKQRKTNRCPWLLGQIHYLQTWIWLGAKQEWFAAAKNRNLRHKIFGLFSPPNQGPWLPPSSTPTCLTQHNTLSLLGSQLGSERRKNFWGKWLPLELEGTVVPPKRLAVPYRERKLDKEKPSAYSFLLFCAA